MKTPYGHKYTLKEGLQIAAFIFLLVGFIGFFILGGPFIILSIVCAALMYPLGIWDDMMEDYQKLFKKP